jgi:phenylpyruvate tautomerase PptA (4-oxalocrotonate tautomerase family)
MPYLSVRTNVDLDGQQQARFLARASTEVARMLGKPERYVMVSLESGLPMVFAGDSTPAAYLELKSLGLPADQTAGFSSSLCRLLAAELAVDPARVFIEFINVERHLWGWDGRTF